ISLDHVVRGFGILVELVAIAVALFDLINKLQLFVVLVTNTDRLSIFLDERLIGRWIVAGHGFRTAGVHIFPIGVQITAGIAWRSGGIVAQAMGQQLRIL